MKECTLVKGLKEEDFITLRWNADVHTVHRKTGEYRILNNHGACLGELIKEDDETYKIVVNERDMENSFYMEIEKIKEMSEMIIHKKLDRPEMYEEKKMINFYPHRQNSLRYAA